jgi:hypothetical protein
VAAKFSSINSLQLQPHLDGDVEKLIGVMWFSWISSGYGDLRIFMELHRRLFLLLRLRDRCCLVDPFGNFSHTTNNVRPSQGVEAAVAHRQHGLDVEDEGHLKNFVVIFVFVEMFCTVRYFS